MNLQISVGEPLEIEWDLLLPIFNFLCFYLNFLQKQ